MSIVMARDGIYSEGPMLALDFEEIHSQRITSYTILDVVALPSVDAR